MTQVTGGDRVVKVERRSTNQKVSKRNCSTGLPGRCVYLRGKLGHLPGEWFHRYRGENSVQVSPAAPTLLQGLGAVKAVLQFDNCDRTQEDLVFPVKARETGQQLTYRLAISLGGDQHSGVQN